jgi:hypothetical protein
MSKQPYLSIIATTRNDNHGGDLLKRTTHFVNGVLHQAKKHNLPLELIIVEWNPPKDKPLLHEILPIPQADEPVSLRYIILPSHIHETYKYAKQIPLFQMIAKNIGIRRAKGEFVLCTNIDIIFSDECFKKIAEKKLKENNFYRTNRCDVPKEIMDINSVDEQLKYSEKNIINRLGRIYHYKNVNNFPGLFFKFPFILLLIDKIIGLSKKIKKSSYDIYSLDFTACGDFTLMSKKDWFRIKGYCELDLYSLHIDSMALISAAAIGMNQELFPKDACVYHIYHDDGWESDYKAPEDIIRFLVKRPALDWYTVYEVGKKLAQLGKPFGLNNDNWGYSDIDLKEFIFTPQ